MKNILIIGGGGHAKVLISIIQKLDQYSIIGYTDLEDKGEILGIKYLGSDDHNFGELENKTRLAVLGLGQIKKSSIRKKIAEKYIDHGFHFPRIIAPSAIVNQDVTIADGTVVMDGVIINSGSRIGEFSILNTGSIIEHDCEIGSFVHIAPGAVLSGSVHIGDGVLIGTGAKVINNVKINDRVIIGDTGNKQSFSLVGRTGHNYLEPRDMGEHRL